jgi:eukaryotic-like serine/threonine-protein kinase
MNSERWQQIDALFQAALLRPPESREAFLLEACDGDSRLRDEVQQLLHSFQAAGSFLETPAGESFSYDGKPTQAQTLTAGQQLAHYEIISQIGAGGMGEVYLARDLKLDRRIALKLLPAQFAAEPERVSRFEREARAASALNHPNIIIIHEVGQESGKHFIVTEYIAGETLRQKLNRGRLTSDDTLAIARQIANALVAAHHAGLVHRDIKPENIMIWPDGLVKVLDFGLAKQLSEPRDLPRTGAAAHTVTPETDPDLLIGSLNYLSPEQVRHEKLDARTDLFSLGVLLYEMLSGVRPFAGTTPAEVCTAILTSTPPPLADPRWWRIVSKALAKERDSRYQTSAELLADLSAQLTPKPKPKRWQRAVPAFIAAGIILIIVGIWFWNSRRGAKSSPLSFETAGAQKLTDLPGEELYPTLSPDAQTLVFVSSQNGNWDIYRQTVGARSTVNLTAGADSYDTQPAFSPDGARIAFRSSRNGGGVFVMNIDGKNVTQITDAGFNPTWSPDGRELAVNDDNIFNYEGRNTYPSASKLWAVNVTSGRKRVITTHDAVQADWSPHGQRLAFWGEQKGGHRDIWTVAADGGSEPVPVTDDGFIDWNPIWSPDGEYLYFLSNRGGEMNLWSVGIDETTGHLRSAPKPATLPSNNCQHVRFARNGKSLIYGQSTSSENVWQVDFDPVRGKIVGAAAFLTQGLKRYAFFSMAPDEQRFVYLARGEPQQDLFTADRAGTPMHRLTDDVAQDIVPRWSPEGQWIAFLSDRSGKYEIWRVRPDGSGLAQMTHEPGREVIAPVWSPDGSKLLYQIRNVNSYIIDANRPGAEQTPQSLAGQPPIGFIPWDWSADGKLLVGWQPLNEQRAIVVYAFDEQRYERFITGFGAYPIWMNDNRHVLFREGGRLLLLDRLHGKWREILTLKPPSQIGNYALSRDNRRLYYTVGSNEADIWLLGVETDDR